MPKDVKSVAEHLRQLIDRSGGDALRVSWGDFYAINEVRRIRQSRMDLISDVAFEEEALLVTYGAKSVLVATDIDAPPSSLQP